MKTVCTLNSNTTRQSEYTTIFPTPVDGRYHLKDVIVGKIYFLLVRIKIKHMELSIIRRETTGSAPNQYNESETITKFEIMDGAPVRGETIPIRLFLGGFELTPTFRDVNKKFSTRYYLNLVLIDEENRRYFKQQEITVFRIPFVSSLARWNRADSQRKLDGLLRLGSASTLFLTECHTLGRIVCIYPATRCTIWMPWCLIRGNTVPTQSCLSCIRSSCIHWVRILNASGESLQHVLSTSTFDPPEFTQIQRSMRQRSVYKTVSTDSISSSHDRTNTSRRIYAMLYKPVGRTPAKRQRKPSKNRQSYPP